VIIVKNVVAPSATETMTLTKGDAVKIDFRKAFLFSAVLAAVGLITVPAAMAADFPASCPAGPWTVSLVSGPTQTTCFGQPCVTFTYQVSGGSKPDHVAGLMPLALFDTNDAVTGSPLSGNQVFNPGEGDVLTLLGIGDMSRQAFKLNPNGTVVEYTVKLEGLSFATGLVPVRVRKGKTDGFCALAGPVEAEVGPHPLATFAEEVTETLGGKCKVVARTDKQTGVTTVTLTPGSDPDCTISDPIPIEQVSVKVGTDDMGPVLFSEGFQFLVGTGTCAYKQYYPSTGPVYRVCW
jgi:hypothetical protein